MRIRVSPQAQSDINAIWLYVAQESGNTAAATKLVRSITDKFTLFARFPFIGKSLEAHARRNVRFFPADPYLIFYSAASSEIRILRIIHGNRDVQSILAEE